MVVNVTFNNISVISWPSILLDEEIGIHSSEITNTPFTSSCILLIGPCGCFLFMFVFSNDDVGYNDAGFFFTFKKSLKIRKG